MADFYANEALDSYPGIASCQAGEVRSVRGQVALPITHAVNDVVHCGWLPAEHVLVDATIDADDLDDGTAIVLAAGITDDPDGATEDPNALIDASTVAQAGGVARMNVVTGVRVAAVANDRRIGITIATGATTEVVGTVGLTFSYRTKDSR